MSKIEIGILIVLCLLPIITLVIVLPKKLKKKAPPPPTTEYKPDKPVVEEEKPKPEKVEKPKTLGENKGLYNDDSFKGYLKDRKGNRTPPTFKEPNFDDPFMNDVFRPNMQQTSKGNEDKSLSEQINELSPELKAMLLSGILDRKNFDEDDE